MRSPDEILRIFTSLRVSTTKGHRAPHKPLLVMLALAEWNRTGKQHFTYDDIETPLRRLLREFLPSSVEKPDPSRPFFHLKNDTIWELVAPLDPTVLQGMKEPSVRIFREHNVFGTFPDDVWDHLKHDPSFLWKIVGAVLVNHFKPTLYSDLLEAAGLDAAAGPPLELMIVWDSYYRRRRDPTFRRRVLDSYYWQCAVCGFRSTFRERHVGVEAAHIQWHSHEGPDDVTNGVALCSLHHHLFDRGVFTIEESKKVKVSTAAQGSEQFQRFVGDFHGREVRQPSQAREYIDNQYLAWHAEEVFWG